MIGDDRVSIIGSSGGGYAALLFGQLVGTDTIHSEAELHWQAIGVHDDMDLAGQSATRSAKMLLIAGTISARCQKFCQLASPSARTALTWRRAAEPRGSLLGS
jgi:hypothetical protein